MGRLCVNCQHQDRKKPRNALYLAGDNEMSQGVTWGKKSPDNAVSRCRRNLEPLGRFGKSYFRPVQGQVDNYSDVGDQQEIKALGRLGWGGGWPLCSGPLAAP